MDALHPAQAILYAALQKPAAVPSYIDGFSLTGVVLLALIPLVFLMRRANGDDAPSAH